MLTVSGLYIYPIKSLGGISLTAASLTDRGLKYDRRWMLVDAENRFLSQREFPVMSLLQVSPSVNGFVITHKLDSTFEELHIGFEEYTDELITVNVWDDFCSCYTVGKEKDEWFSNALNISCRLVYMPDKSRRLVDERYAHQQEITSLSDGYPLLLIGEASLQDLNGRLSSPVPMNRFRPNIVFSGGSAFYEDEMKYFEINHISFNCAKPCARCVMTTIDQSTGIKNKEPLATLSKYRRDGNKILFGQNLLYDQQGTLRIGDRIHVREVTAPLF